VLLAEQEAGVCCVVADEPVVRATSVAEDASLTVADGGYFHELSS
jgi:hypothetical protein